MPDSLDLGGHARNAQDEAYDRRAIEMIMSIDPTPSSKVTPIDPRQGELAERVARGAPTDGVHATAFQPLALIRASGVGQPLPSVYSPSFCVVVQGRKRAIVGEQSYYYDAFNYLVVSVTLPVFSQIVDASPERPYLCLRLDVDVRAVAELLHATTAAQEPTDDRPLYVARTSSDVLDVILRLVRLLESPGDVLVLAPLVVRELWYRLIKSDMGPRLAALVEADGPVQRVHRAIEILRRNFDKSFHVEDLADAAHMSVSVFHARFKAITSLSPLQFQKQLRLHEARRLLIVEGLDAVNAAHRVGYESPSQFSREYRRLFGAPPRREIAVIRAARS